MDINKSRVAVFASGAGTNFEALVKHPEHGKSYEIVLLVSDKPQSAAVAKAHTFGIDTFSFLPKEYAAKEEFETEIVRECRQRNIEWIVLAGYMRLVGAVLLTAYPQKIINIHPSLLPSFPGKDAIGQALAARATVTGVTVHYVDSGMDTGEIIRQIPVSIEPADTSETLSKRVQAVEHVLLPTVVSELVRNVRGSVQDG